jgi:hypothetical protein
LLASRSGGDLYEEEEKEEWKEDKKYLTKKWRSVKRNLQRNLRLICWVMGKEKTTVTIGEDLIGNHYASVTILAVAGHSPHHHHSRLDFLITSNPS